MMQNAEFAHRGVQLQIKRLCSINGLLVIINTNRFANFAFPLVIYLALHTANYTLKAFDDKNIIRKAKKTFKHYRFLERQLQNKRTYHSWSCCVHHAVVWLCKATSSLASLHIHLELQKCLQLEIRNAI